jgi:hypothetical protein
MTSLFAVLRRYPSAADALLGVEQRARDLLLARPLSA